MKLLRKKLSPTAEDSQEPGNQDRWRILSDGAWKARFSDVLLVGPPRRGKGFARTVRQVEDPALVAFDGQPVDLGRGPESARQFQRFFAFQHVIAECLVRIHGFGMHRDDSGNEINILVCRGTVALTDQPAGKPVASVIWMDGHLMDDDDFVAYELKQVGFWHVFLDYTNLPFVSSRPCSRYQLRIAVDHPSRPATWQLFVPADLWDRLSIGISDVFAEERVDSMTLTIRRDRSDALSHN